MWSETEIWYFWDEFVIFLKDEDVLKFKVSVAVAFEVEVFEPLADFFE